MGCLGEEDMSTAEERMQILNMVAEGKITAEEGAKLLEALKSGKGGESEAKSGSGRRARWFRVKVTDLASGRTKVNVKIPMGLLNVGIKMGAKFAPEMGEVDLNEIMRAVQGGAEGLIVDVVDEEEGEHVEVFVE